MPGYKWVAPSERQQQNRRSPETGHEVQAPARDNADVGEPTPRQKRPARWPAKLKAWWSGH